MKVVRIILSCVVLGVACAVSAQQAQHDQTGPRRVLTTTRLVSLFSELENQWMQAVQHKDGSALARLLGDHFQLWTPETNGPTPREDWQKQALAQSLVSFHFRQMAVRSLREDSAIVSFVLSKSVQSGGKLKVEAHFVVDIWSKEGDQWVCTDRYASPMLAVTRLAPAEDHKPSGKQ
jgi:Domain of unknown function (DUF4440)